ncbi:hypothetical protein [Actinomadura sp. 3N508]|uniref:hypothetical protein n=1 Tax=Actinomadura sp. 3N508 TaxID=3375153 RepID=UPI0037AB4A68
MPRPGAWGIHYIQNPALPDGTGVLVSTDFEGEWVANIPADPARTPQRTTEIIHTMIGLPDIEIELLGETTFEYGQTVTDRFREGPVLLGLGAAIRRGCLETGA